MTATITSTRIDQWTLGALWMRACASACGYTPETAKPLGLAYAQARRWPNSYARTLVSDGSINFGGLAFHEPTDGTIRSSGRSLRAGHYDRAVVSQFNVAQEHHVLYYAALDVADAYHIEVLDQRDTAWRAFAKAWGRRRTLSLGLAAELLQELKPC